MPSTVRINRRLVGHGFGGIFRGLIKFFKPLVSFLLPSVTKAVKSKTGRKLLKQAKKSAIKAGISTVTDVLAGENIKKSAGTNLKKASVDVLDRMKEITPRKKKFRRKKKLYNLFD